MKLRLLLERAGIEVRFLDGLAVHIRMSFVLAHAALLHRLHLPLKMEAAKFYLLMKAGRFQMVLYVSLKFMMVQFMIQQRLRYLISQLPCLMDQQIR